MNPKKILTYDFSEVISQAELTIAYLKCNTSANLEELLFSILNYEEKKEKLIKFLALYPFKIKPELLKPKHNNPLLDSLVPPQTFLQFGSQ